MDLSKKTSSWYSEQDVAWPKAAIIGGVWITALALIASSPLGRSAQEQIEERMNFNFREFVDMTPPLSPQLKIILFGDRSLAKLGNPDLPVNMLTDILEKIYAREPRVVLIDRMFSTVPFATQEEMDRLAKTAAEGAPTYIAAFTLPEHIKIPRDPLTLDEEFYQQSHYLKNSDEIPSWMDPQPFIPYGASSYYRNLFISGHAEQYRIGKFLPFKRLQDDRIFPHFALFAAENLAIVDDNLLVNYQKVWLNRDGAALYNTRPYSRFRSQSKTQVISLANLVQGKGADLINPGDTVLFIPMFFTGSTDYKDSPVGKIAGGLLVATVVNSVLTGDWLVPIGFNTVFIILFGLLGLLVGIRFHNYPFWMMVVSFLILTTLSGLWMFASYGYLLPWLFADVAFFTCALTIFAERARIADMKSLHLRIALRGSLPPKFLNRVTSNPRKLDNKADQRVVTIMFVDVVGFSRYAEKQTATDVFSSLKDLLNELTQTIHRHDGVVNRTLGDGMLAFFGYNYVVGEVQDPRHAMRALECALEIQQRCVELCLAASKEHKPVYPLRIGINTAAVQIGDLGDAEHVDFTLIGHGVNLAKRLEESCENFRVMISRATYNAIEEDFVNKHDMRKRLVLLKHHSEPNEVYEVNPFEQDSKELMAAGRAYWEFAGIRRRESRVEVPSSITIEIESKFGTGRVVNFSKSGVAVELDTYLAKGMEIEFVFNTEDGLLNDQLEDKNISPVLGQLRSGRPFGNVYRHGIVFKNLSSTQKDMLQFFLEQEVTKQGDLLLNQDSA